ncbi:MAG: hypothetical protein U0R80_17730 [Nocardioidaceae bacterium]
MTGLATTTGALRRRLPAWTGLLLTAAMLPLMAAPAATASGWQQHGSVDVSARPARVEAGESAVVRGTAEGYDAGSPVLLRRHLVGGWSTTQQTRLDRDLGFRFVVTPPKGHQRYRVVVQDRAHSWSAGAETTVDALWTPTLSATAHWTRTTGGVRILHVEGDTSYRGSDRLSVQWQTDDGRGWTVDSLLPVRRGHFEGDVAVWPGTSARVRLPGDQVARRGAADAVRVPDLPPATLVLDDAAGSGDPDATAFQDLVIDLPAHQVVTLKGLTSEMVDAVRAPSGTALTVRDPEGLDFVDVTTRSAGRYLIDRNASGGTVYASTPKVVRGQVGTPLSPTRDVPGQYLRVLFAGVAGEFVAGTPSLLFAPDGSSLAETMSPSAARFVYRLPRDGDYTWLDYDDSGDAPVFDLAEVPQQTATIDGPQVHVGFGVPSFVVVPATAGHAFMPDRASCRQVSYAWTLLPPDGETDQLRPDLMPRADGDFLFYVTPEHPGTDALGFVSTPTFALGADGSAVSRSTADLGCAAYRATLTGTAGQLVRLGSTPGDFTPALFDHTGFELLPVGWHTWRLPADGTYSVRFAPRGSDPGEAWTGSFSAVTPAVVEVDAVGKVVPVTLGTAGGHLLAHLAVPAGQNYRAYFDPGTLSGGVATIATASGDRLRSFSVLEPTAFVGTTEPGGLYLSLASTDPSATGTATIRLVRIG